MLKGKKNRWPKVLFGNAPGGPGGCRSSLWFRPWSKTGPGYEGRALSGFWHDCCSYANHDESWYIRP